MFSSSNTSSISLRPSLSVQIFPPCELLRVNWTHICIYNFCTTWSQCIFNHLQTQCSFPVYFHLYFHCDLVSGGTLVKAKARPTHYSWLDAARLLISLFLGAGRKKRKKCLKASFKWSPKFTAQEKCTYDFFRVLEYL